MIALPNADEVDQYGVPSASGSARIPFITDGEAVCRVFTIESGTGAYWSRGDVDVHILHSRQHSHIGSPVSGLAESFGGGSWLATALRERRAQRHHLLRAGVQTTASGLVVLGQSAAIVGRPR